MSLPPLRKVFEPVKISSEKQLKREEQKDVLGVCLVGKRVSSGSYEGVCSGSVVRGLLHYKKVHKKVFLVISDDVLSKKDLSGDLKRECKSFHSFANNYRLFFKDAMDSNKLKTYDLNEVISDEEEVALDAGQVIICIDPDAQKLNKKSGILDYRPFTVNTERTESLGKSICQIVEGNTSQFAVRTLDLEHTGEKYLLKLPVEGTSFETLTELREAKMFNHLYPRGAIILREGDREAVGVLDFVDDKVSPVIFTTLQVFERAGSSSNQVGDEDGNSITDPEEVVIKLDKQPSDLECVEDIFSAEESGRRQAHPKSLSGTVTGKDKNEGKAACPVSKKDGNPDQVAANERQVTESKVKVLLSERDRNTDKESVNISSIKNDVPTGKSEMSPKELSSYKGRSPEVQHHPKEGQLSASKTNLVADLKRIASEKDYKVFDNEGKGNCMFIALSDQLALKEICTVSHKELRQSSVEYLRNNPRMPACGTELFSFLESEKRPPWNEYLENMEKDGIWGDNMILYAVANYYGVSIRVVSNLSQAHERVIHPQPECPVRSNKELVVGHVSEFHYVSLRPKYGVPRPVTNESPSDASPVVSGHSTYKRTFPAEIGEDKIPVETNIGDHKTLSSNKGSGFVERIGAAKYEDNNEARSSATKPVTNAFPAPRDVAATSPSLTFSEEEANAKKLNRLLIEGGAAALRKVFDRIHPPEKLKGHLDAKKSTLEGLRDEKILNERQWLKLFPSDGATPESKSFDFSLLFIILTTISGLRSSPQTWCHKPPERSSSLEAQISRLKYHHDQLYQTRISIDNKMFSSLWQEVSAILIEFGLEQTEIDSYKVPCAEEGCGGLPSRVDGPRYEDMCLKMELMRQEINDIRRILFALQESVRYSSANGAPTTERRETKSTASQTEDLLGGVHQALLATASQTEDPPGGVHQALLDTGYQTEGSLENEDQALLDTASQTDVSLGGEDQALLERSQQGEETVGGRGETKDTGSQTEDLLGNEDQALLVTASQTDVSQGGEDQALLERRSPQVEETVGDASPECLDSDDDPSEWRDIDENADNNTLHHYLITFFCMIFSHVQRSLFEGEFSPS